MGREHSHSVRQKLNQPGTRLPSFPNDLNSTIESEADNAGVELVEARFKGTPFPNRSLQSISYIEISANFSSMS